MDAENAKAALALKELKARHISEVRQLVGLLSVYRHIVPHLYDLLKNNSVSCRAKSKASVG